MPNSYELAVLVHPDLETDLEKATSKIEKLVKDVDGKITATDNWGKRKLAYKIKDVDHAIYVFYTVDMPASGVKKLNDTLNITDEVVRFLITKLDLKAIAKAEALKDEKAKKAAEHADRNTDDSSESARTHEEE